jgi:hypothetical protein
VRPSVGDGPSLATGAPIVRGAAVLAVTPLDGDPHVLEPAFGGAALEAAAFSEVPAS